jgi:hypothetical protein
MTDVTGAVAGIRPGHKLRLIISNDNRFRIRQSRSPLAYLAWSAPKFSFRAFKAYLIFVSRSEISTVRLAGLCKSVLPRPSQPGIALSDGIDIAVYIVDL